MMEEKYGEHTIRYNEQREIFEAYIDNCVEMTSVKLSELKKRLDKSGEEKAKFGKVKIFKIDSYRGEEYILIEGIINSISEDGKLWVSWKSGKREKVWSYDPLYIDTVENRDIFAEGKKVFDRIVQEKKHLDKIEESMKKYQKK